MQMSTGEVIGNSHSPDVTSLEEEVSRQPFLSRPLREQEMANDEAVWETISWKRYPNNAKRG
jgi:hypothetical protein